MRTGIFGWDYPPGCSGPPEYDETCAVCGKPDCDSCVCPECPVCEAVGDPECYEKHGMVLTPEQLQSRKEAEEAIAKHDADMAAWAAEEQRLAEEEKRNPPEQVWD